MLRAESSDEGFVRRQGINETAMQKTKVFIAYAREDEAFLHRLREYLAPLERNQAIEVWYDGKIEAGEQWDKKIKTHLHAADLILLLVFGDF